MLFNSLPFVLLFLPLALLLYYGKMDRLQPRILLLLFSGIFYGLTQPGGLPLLLASILWNWYVGRRMQSYAEYAQKKRRAWLIAGLTLNLGFLCWFKYLDFIIRNLGITDHFSLHLQPHVFPLGISFFTLQQIMYLVDCYEDTAAANSLVNHAVFASFFPYITAGPISRAQEIVPQLQSRDLRMANYDRLARSAALFVLGLTKKAVVADSLAFLGARLSESGTGSLLDAWALSIAYTLQIYFDFSGYSDMARAVALMFNIEIPRNFNTPYRALSVTEFWERWHMTLSGFIRVYLYTPMLRSMKRVTPFRAAAAIILTMFLVGLWHGPSWTFAMFGTLHGIALGINQFWRKSKRRLPNWVAWASTFLFVNFTFVFFRSPDLASALHSLAVMFGAGMNLASTLHSSLTGSDYVLLLAGVFFACLGRNSDRITEESSFSWRSVAATAALALACLIFLNSTLSKGFIYRDF